MMSAADVHACTFLHLPQGNNKLSGWFGRLAQGLSTAAMLSLPVNVAINPMQSDVVSITRSVANAADTPEASG